MLRTNGGVFLNGATVPASSAIYPGDTIQTQPSSLARIEITGSTADIAAETVLQFDGDEIRLDHGTVSVNTSREFKVRAGCVIVTPVNQDWTQYSVTDTDGKVTVSAVKNDVNIDSRANSLRPAKTSGRSERVTVREGEQKSREEKCGGADIKWSEAIDAKGAILNSPYAIGTGAVIVVGGTLCVLLCFSNQPISPSCPDSKGSSCK